VRAELGIAADTPVALYTGTFEAYQGLDLLFASMRLVQAARGDARLVLVGGQPHQVARAREQARAAGIERVCVFTGQRPPGEMPWYLDAANVLVSPRSTGWNTPLKIYQYLQAGKPIVATRLLTHTQVLSDEVAVLTPPTPEGFAAGMLEMFQDRAKALDLGGRARQLADTKYTYDAYLDRTRTVCAALVGEAPHAAGEIA
jgi:glycosyltransferase involved in cell wall biosynthesis